MGRIPKYTIEQKIKACEEYLSGKKTVNMIAKELSTSKNLQRMVYEWIYAFKANGAQAFENKPSNASYSKEFKEKVVIEYLSGKVSLETLANKYHIPRHNTIGSWVKKYNNHIELEDYNPHPEVYMADTLKVNKEKKIEIVKWCLDHDRDIKLTATQFKGNYAQIYQWVKKYELKGEDGLDDKRGRRKKQEDLTEVEILKRKLKQSEAEKEEFRRKYELLKKAEQIERW